MHPPKIFISATSGDLRSIRQIVKDSLITINYHPVDHVHLCTGKGVGISARKAH